MGGFRRSFGIAARLSALLSLLFLPGCEGAKPFKYRPSSEIPEGPGMFSGKKGKFVIIGGEGAEESKDEEKSNGQPKSQPGGTR